MSPRGTPPPEKGNHKACDLRLRLAQKQHEKNFDAALEHLLANESELEAALDIIEALIGMTSTVTDIRNARTFLKKHNRKWRKGQ